MSSQGHCFFQILTNCGLCTLKHHCIVLACVHAICFAMHLLVCMYVTEGNVSRCCVVTKFSAVVHLNQQNMLIHSNKMKTEKKKECWHWRVFKKVFNIVATERNRRVTLDGDQALNGKSQTSEYTTQRLPPKAPVYIVELIRLCGADMFPPHDNELPCCVPYLPGPNTNRTLTCLYCHQQSKYWKR